ncbi:MAG: hypothetical protein KTV16_15265 [Acidimicrobiia bacterium]|nr:hypothetical protein [Acidimicrobiia bacterium]
MGLLALLSPAAGAAVQDSPQESHCVVDVSGGTATEAGCFESLRAARNSVWQSTARGVSGARSSSVLGVHFKGQNYTGSSITITGSGCSGLVWRPSGSWNNNIESSHHYCGGSPTKFYDSSSCAGSNKPISGSAPTLGWMNNRASCVRYG